MRLALSLLVVAGLVLLNSWFFAAMGLMAVAMVVTGYSGTWRDWLTWLAMLVGFALFATLRAAMEGEVEARPLYLYVIHIETLGGLIPPATVWLQSHLQDSILNPWGVLDVLSTVVYISFFIVPQVVVVYLWKTGGPFRPYVAAACLLFAGALAVHFLLPTAPPWMAARDGYLPQVDRIGMGVLTAASSTLTQGGYSAQANDVAAMPSVHQGLVILAMLALASHVKRAGPAAFSYAALMLFSITYLGEHYAVDGLAGGAMAWAAWRLTARRPGGNSSPGPSGSVPLGIRPEKSG
jgi:hypothetical protein